MKRSRRPTSVGEMLKEEFLRPLGLTQRHFADHIGVEVKAINRIVNNKTSITMKIIVEINVLVCLKSRLFPKENYQRFKLKIRKSINKKRTRMN